MLEELTIGMEPTPISLVTLQHASQLMQRSEEQWVLNAKFLRRELTARRAHQLSLLLSMPEELARQPPMQDLTAKYWERLLVLLEQRRLSTMEDEASFSERLQRNFSAQVGETRRTVAAGLGSLHAEGQEQLDPERLLAIDQHLDALFLARVGYSFLAEHFLASRTPRPGYVGIIEQQCSPVRLCQELAQQIEAKTQSTWGTSPRIEVHGDAAQTFAFVPSHIRFVVGELLTNATKATIRHHLRGVHALNGHHTLHEGPVTLPPIRVIIAVSGEAITVKVADLAGGVARSNLKDIWSYRAMATSHWRSGIGLGLPLARLYAKYFGGSMHMVPMEGFGTDCYAAFNRLSHCNCENILPVTEGRPSWLDSSLGPPTKPREGKWRAAISLFDAQARRA